MMNDLRKYYKLVGMKMVENDKLIEKPVSQINSEFGYYLGMIGMVTNTGSLIVTLSENERI